MAGFNPAARRKGTTVKARPVEDAMARAARKTRGRENNRKGGAEQAALVQWAELNLGRFPELKLLIGIPNGAKLAGNAIQCAKQWARLAKEGARKGVPDFCLPVARGGFHSLWIELKSGEARASKEQREWVEKLRSQGNRAEVCHGWQEAAKLITAYMEAKMHTQLLHSADAAFDHPKGCDTCFHDECRGKGECEG